MSTVFANSGQEAYVTQISGMYLLPIYKFILFIPRSKEER